MTLRHLHSRAMPAALAVGADEVAAAIEPRRHSAEGHARHRAHRLARALLA